jgi:adenine-specific DNA-methyltransferase
VQEQLKAFLFMPPDDPLEQLPQPARNYILAGEVKGVHKGYKCRIREKWYIAPSVWIPDAFLLRQVHAYPKLILNDAQATCTDTIHRVRFKNGVGGKLVTAAFLNSLTFAFAEVTGRSYGGGVLTFEPSEAESLPLPLIGAEQLDLNHLCALLRDDDIDGVLDITDRTLLIEGLGLGAEQVRRLRGIWGKLRDRRINRKHNRKTVEYPVQQESLKPPKHEEAVGYQPLLGGFDEG